MKNGCKNKSIDACNRTSNCSHGSLDVLKGRVQRSMAVIVTSRMKNPPKKLLFFAVFA